jgi:hypothetical protein
MGKCVEKQKEATRKFRKRFFDSLAELSYPLPPGIRLTQEVRWRDAEVSRENGQVENPCTKYFMSIFYSICFKSNSP